MTRQTAEKTIPNASVDPLNLPQQMLEAARKGAILSPQLWHEGWAVLAEAADEQAKALHLLAQANSPVTASAIISEYWQNAAQRGFETITRLMMPTLKSE